MMAPDNRSLHIEMKDRLGTASALLGRPAPAGVSHTRRAIAAQAIADEIDVDVLVGRPMALKIVEKLLPVGREASFSTSHSAMPRRVQYFLGDVGGGTSSGGALPSAR